MVDNVTDLNRYREGLSSDSHEPPLKGGGGDGTFGDMEARVKRLEEAFEKFDSKLDALRMDASEIKGKLANAPTSAQMAELKSDLSGISGRLTGLPTTTQLILFAIAIFAAAGLTRYFGH